MADETETPDGGDDEAEAAAGGKKKLILFIALPVVIVLLAGVAAFLFLGGSKDAHAGDGKDGHAAEDGHAGDGHGDHAADGHGDGEHGGDHAADDHHGDGHGGDGHDGHGAAHDVVFYQLPDILVNIQNEGGSPRYLKLALTLELDGPDRVAMIEPAMPRVLDRFQAFLRELRVEDLSGSSGSYRLRLELLRRVNLAVAPADVRAVLIEEMLIQ